MFALFTDKEFLSAAHRQKKATVFSYLSYGQILMVQILTL